MEETLHEKLEKLKKSNQYAFHMPGHKRMEKKDSFSEVMSMDITEIEDFDNLHHAEGILKEEQQFAAELYGAENSFFLVNGSTAGILAAICATTTDGENIVFSRNAHKSAYHALYLKGLRAEYLYPDQGGKNFLQGKINPEDVEKLLEKTNARVVFITSPTYEGIVSDIPSIAKIVHEKNGILIVDEAHGAHFGFHPYFPQSAVKQGADIVVQSLHKTLPSLTQTALLHICSERVSCEEVKRWLGIFQTSSPSYVLMGSMSKCLHMLENHAEEYFSRYKQRLQIFYDAVKTLSCLKVPNPDTMEKWFSAETDPSKILIFAENLEDKSGKVYGGKQLAEELLSVYGLQMEMVSEKYVLAMTSIYDSEEGFRRLTEALFDIDAQLVRAENTDSTDEVRDQQNLIVQSVMPIKAALDSSKEERAWADCVDAVSAEYIYLYPPGSPIVVPGEKITAQIHAEIEKYRKCGLNVQGPSDYTWNRFMTVK